MYFATKQTALVPGHLISFDFLRVLSDGATHSGVLVLPTNTSDSLFDSFTITLVLE